jgi:hypothetical protein
MRSSSHFQTTPRNITILATEPEQPRCRRRLEGKEPAQSSIMRIAIEITFNSNTLQRTWQVFCQKNLKKSMDACV